MYGLPVGRELLEVIIYESIYCQVSLGAHLFTHPLHRFGCLVFCWIGYCVTSYGMLQFKHHDNDDGPEGTLKEYKQLKESGTWIIILSSGMYGIAFSLGVLNVIPNIFESTFYAVGDIITKGLFVFVFSVLLVSERFQKIKLQNMKIARRLSAMEAEIDAQKMFRNSKDKFLRFIFHEVRMPLHTMASILELLSVDNLISDEYIVTLLSCIETMKRVLDDVLLFEQMSSCSLIVKKRPFHLHQTLGSIIGRYTATARQKGVELYLNTYGIVIPTDFKLFGDDRKISQAICNLLSNAIKYTASGGSVYLNVSLGPIIEKKKKRKFLIMLK